MWKIVLIYIGVSLALFCSPLKGKEVLDKIIKEREKAKGNEIVSYKIDNIDKSDSTQNIFYITATVIKNAQTKEVKDTIHIYTTRDGILVEETK
jgi:hypothetical protein